jgi:CubicO group peptidase (beta-lactamase class C family)
LTAAAVCPAQDYVDQVVERARKEFLVPGIAVAIVKDGHLVLVKGYGVRKLGEPEPVTPHSLFRIASNTKAFTAAALAMLVDEGKLRWDDAVIQHMRDFQMYDPYVTRELTVRDLLVHRSGLGLGAGDLMFVPPSDLSRQEIIRRLRFVKPVASFRSRFAYDNLLLLVAGQLIPAVTGKSWDDFVKERIFTSLGMTSTSTSSRVFKTASDVAISHCKVDGKLEPLPPEEFDNNGPSCAIGSCVADMAKWVTVQLNHGDMGTSRLFSEAQSREMWSPQAIIPASDPLSGSPAALGPLRPSSSAYGLGWVLTDYRGKKLVSHSGDLWAYLSRVTMVPDLKLGIVVLTNQQAGGASQAVTYTILDHYLNAPETDWVAPFLAQARKGEADAEEAVKKAAAKRNANSRPSLPSASYAGRYRDAWYGDMVIEEHSGKLTISFTHSHRLTGDLEHWQYDTFVARWRDRTLEADAYVTFSLKPDGLIDEVKMEPVSPLTDWSFDFQELLFRPVAADAPPR